MTATWASPEARRLVLPRSYPEALRVKNSTLRVVTALAAAPAVLGLAYAGGWWFGVLVLAGALLIQWEVYAMMTHGGGKPRRHLGLLLGALLVLRILVPAVWPLVVLVVLFLIGLVPFQHRREDPLVSLADTVFGAIYPTALLGFLLELRVARGPDVGNAEAFVLTLAVFLLVWATDIFAYYVGRSVGRRKLSPHVSPNKTWEGAIGGAGAALLVALVLRGVPVGAEPLLAFLDWPHVAVVAFLCGILGQVGDLAESKLKRSVEVKDSGSILPGHGGLLDRFDALIFVVPVVYLYLAHVAGVFS